MSIRGRDGNGIEYRSIESHAPGSKVVVVGVLLVGLVAGCGVGAEDQARPVDATVAVQPTPGQTTDATRTTLVWMVKNQALVRTVRSVASPPSVEELLATLVSGPTGSESRRGISTRLSATDVLAASTFDLDVPEGTAAVVVGDALRAQPADEQILALGQVVLTLTSAGYEQVVFVGEDGEVVAVPGASGAILTGPVSASDYASLRLRSN